LRLYSAVTLALLLPLVVILGLLPVVSGLVVLAAGLLLFAGAVHAGKRMLAAVMAVMALLAISGLSWTAAPLLANSDWSHLAPRLALCLATLSFGAVAVLPEVEGAAPPGHSD